MSLQIQALTALARGLGEERPLDDVMQLVADHIVVLLDAPRVSVRVLDDSRTQLLATARAGEPLHDSVLPFQLGEGLIGWIAKSGHTLRSGDAEHDPRFQPRPDLHYPMVSFVGVPLTSSEGVIGVLSALHPQPDFFHAEHEELLVLVAAMCAPQLEIARLSRLAQLDPLTGALNRRGLEAALMRATRDPGARLAVAMADIDHFKRINDERGHAAGDTVLRDVARILTSVLRSGDTTVRWGGEEFLMVLPGADLARAVAIAERARTAVAAACPVTVSLGVAERRAGEPPDALVMRADAALYGAKQAGRNRVQRG